MLAALLLLAAGCGRTPGVRTPAPSAVPSPAPAGSEFRILFLNVGQGDSALLELPGGKWALVDAGPAAGFPALNGMMRLHGVKKLEAVFISHPHNDHIGGLEGALGIAACPVIYATPADFGKPTEKLNETAAAHGAALQTLSPGDKVEIAGVTFTALGPNGRFTAEENDNSLVLMAEYNGFRALFAGDQSLEAEAALLKTGRSVGCDVLKVGHHGKEDASSEAFIRAASPRYAVVTSADSGENVPAPAVLARLRENGADTLVLGRTGSLLVSSGGQAPQLLTPAEPPAQLTISGIDVKAESIEIYNPSEKDVDLTGWGLLSDKGSQYFAFPDGLVVKRGGTIRVYSGIEQAQVPPDGLFWTEKKIWHDKKEDAASLLDPYGRTAASK